MLNKPSVPGALTRLYSIDFLRGCAALAVLGRHASKLLVADGESGWLYGIYAFFQHGDLGVPLFFVISGFCIHFRWAKQYAEGGKSTLDFKRFWQRRFWRLYPPYLVALCCTMSLVALSVLFGKHGLTPQDYPQPKATWMAVDFAAHLLMLHGLHPQLDQGGGNGVYWTLAREEYFYLLYIPLLYWRRAWGLPSALLAVIAVGLVTRTVFQAVFPVESVWWSFITSSAPVLWVQWCLGMIAVEAYFGIIRLPRWCSHPGMLLVWTVAGEISDRTHDLLSPLLWGMAFFTLVNWCVRREQAGEWGNNALMRWGRNVGCFSYSLYLVHVPIRNLVARGLNRWLHADDPWFLALGATLAAVAGYFGGKLFYALVERHFVAGQSVRRFFGAKPASEGRAS